MPPRTSDNSNSHDLKRTIWLWNAWEDVGGMLNDEIP